MERDEGIDSLAETIRDMFEFVGRVDALKKIEAHKQTIVKIVQQTTECAYFILDYRRNDSFCLSSAYSHSLIHTHRLSTGIKTVKNTVSEADSTIKRYKDVFAELRKAFEGDATIETEITVLRILNNVESSGERPMVLYVRT